jgi:acylphosphatase
MLKAVISGDVQGVGYRYTVLSMARNFKITGFVRNLNNGGVEVQAEGEKDELDRFLDAIRIKSGGIDVQSISTEWKDAEGKFSGFTVLRTNDLF